MLILLQIVFCVVSLAESLPEPLISQDLSSYCRNMGRQGHAHIPGKCAAFDCEYPTEGSPDFKLRIRRCVDPEIGPGCRLQESDLSLPFPQCCPSVVCPVFGSVARKSMGAGDFMSMQQSQSMEDVPTADMHQTSFQNMQQSSMDSSMTQEEQITDGTSPLIPHLDTGLGHVHGTLHTLHQAQQLQGQALQHALEHLQHIATHNVKPEIPLSVSGMAKQYQQSSMSQTMSQQLTEKMAQLISEMMQQMQGKAIRSSQTAVGYPLTDLSNTGNHVSHSRHLSLQQGSNQSMMSSLMQSLLQSPAFLQNFQAQLLQQNLMGVGGCSSILNWILQSMAQQAMQNVFTPIAPAPRMTQSQQQSMYSRQIPQQLTATQQMSQSNYLENIPKMQQTVTTVLRETDLPFQTKVQQTPLVYQRPTVVYIRQPPQPCVPRKQCRTVPIYSCRDSESHHCEPRILPGCVGTTGVLLRIYPYQTCCHNVPGC